MSRPYNIYLVRHGESEANADKGVYAKTPDWRIELTPVGREQAAKAGLLLAPLLTQPYGVYLSPYRRTVQTWDEINLVLHGLHRVSMPSFVKQDLRLREMERGNPADRDKTLVEYRLTERERHKQGSLLYRIAGGESGSQVFDRVASFRETLERTAERGWFPDNLIIVGHSFTMRVTEMVLGDLDVDAFHSLPDPANAEVVRLRLTGDSYVRA